MLLAPIFFTIVPPLHPKIPLVDLAFEVKRQIVVDQEIGQYLGHPTTCLLEDGQTVLCVYPKGHGKGVIYWEGTSFCRSCRSNPRLEAVLAHQSRYSSPRCDTRSSWASRSSVSSAASLGASVNINSASS